MINIIFIISIFIVSLNTNAKTIVDVYGLADAKAKIFSEKYFGEVAEVETLISKEFAKSNLSGDFETKELNLLVKRKQALIDKIKKENGFLFVEFDTLFYGQDKDLFTTVEIIDKNQPNRLRFVDLDIKEEFKKKDLKSKPDLIDEMIAYNLIVNDLFMNHKISPAPPSCPVYHCILGFEHPKFKPYLSIFNNGVKEQKAFIIDSLKNEKDPNRKAAAVFLVGHFKDPNEIVNLLTPLINNKVSDVRNNAMRVIAQTIAKGKLLYINLLPFIDALDSPYDTDRNKALAVINLTMGVPSQRHVVIDNAKEKLLALLRLNQPNNGDIAYDILKRISGKNFGRRDYFAWQNWIENSSKS